MNPTVALTKYQSSPESLQNTITLCNGFEGLKNSDSVLIKPNLVAWDNRYPIAPFGVFTTTRLVEDLIQLLRDFGIRKIIVGEGSVQFNKEAGTMEAFEGLGYLELQKKYDIELVDFNKSKSHVFEIPDAIDLMIAKEAVETDFFINFPVLKTHGQTKISLGLKNLKGSLKLKSKRACHHTKLDLEFLFSHIADFVKPNLTIIDGIYALEKGALHFGNAFLKNLIVASQNILGADVVAAKTIGYEAADIAHLKHYADRHQESLSLDDYELKGEEIDDFIHPLKWDWSWTDDNTAPKIFEKFGITGVGIPKYDKSVCSGCSPIVNMINILALSAFKGQPLPKVEILNGKKMLARKGYDKTLLLGNCIIKANEGNANINETIQVKGCPPNEEDVVNAFKTAGLDVNPQVYYQFLKDQGEKYKDKDDYDPRFFQG